MTRPRIIAVALAAAAIFVAGVANAEHFDAGLTRLQLEQRFAELRAKKTLRVDKPLRWEYSFSSADGQALEALSVMLVAEDYKIVSLRPPRGGEAASTLHVMRVEQHTPQSLEQRSAELKQRAADQGVTYDGVDAQ
ncbi:MAG TPA: ribonuclease E inhibitor RraB [Gammaproteobacteria bacterium]|nr:ribonuclease E inhibitor RraB [Gammaproteobacteria bacterium]